MSRTLHRMILALAVGAVLLSSWPAAAQPRSRVELGLKAHTTLTPLDFLAHLWRLVDQAWTKTGCSIDPHGACTPGQNTSSEPPAQVDTGCGIDPNGTCASSAPEADSGCDIDPHGACVSGH